MLVRSVGNYDNFLSSGSCQQAEEENIHITNVFGHVLCGMTRKIYLFMVRKFLPCVFTINSCPKPGGVQTLQCIGLLGHCLGIHLSPLPFGLLVFVWLIVKIQYFILKENKWISMNIIYAYYYEM